MNPRRALRGLIISALLSALVYAVLAGLSDARTVGEALRSLSWTAVAGMIALTLTCYTIRSLRWRYLVGVAGGRIGVADAAYIQYAGMTMGVTPGKVGEVLKALLAREICGLPASKGIALVFSERLGDVVAVTALSTGAVGAFTNSGPALLAAAVALVAGIAVLASPRFHRLVLSVVMRQCRTRKYLESTEAILETVRATLRPPALTASVVMSAAAWTCEGLAFALCIRAMGFDGLAVPSSVAIYAIATLVGAFTFMPGGIGLTEASLAGLLVASGMPAGGASATTLLIRVITMWMGVALGWAALASRPALLRAVIAADESGAGDDPDAATLTCEAE